MIISKKVFCQLLMLAVFAAIFNCYSGLIASEISGKVISVADGDTITILSADNTKTKVRLYGIDCPEKAQAFGSKAHKLTSALVGRKVVQVIPYDFDKYERTVGVVFVDGKNVNVELLKAGLAWQYQKYCKNEFCQDWLSLESKARSSGLGLWTENNPVPPWDWRKGQRNANTPDHTTDGLPSNCSGYHGNIKSHAFHVQSCADYNCKNCTKVFDTKEAAISAGYKPCGRCKP